MATMKIKKGDMLIMVSDTFPGNPLEVGNNVALVLECESDSEIQHLYDVMCEKGLSLIKLR